jgi:hypothetical protein
MVKLPVKVVNLKVWNEKKKKVTAPHLLSSLLISCSA